MKKSKKIIVMLGFMVLFIGMYSLRTEAASKTLKIDQNLIDQVGIQSPGDGNCSAYALAYCRTILDGRVRNWSEFWLDGTGAIWDWGNYSRHYSDNKIGAFQTIIVCTNIA